MSNGYIYRIAYTGNAAKSTAAMAPDKAMKEQGARGVGVPLAMARRETQATTGARIEVRSPSFIGNGAIPLKHSEYADGVAPRI